MAGYVCTIAGGKGGVGKTTTAVNVGAVLEERGYDVVVVDADLGMANIGEMLGVDHEVSLHEILAGDSTVSEGLAGAQGGLTVVPGEQNLEAFAEADPAKLRKVIKTLRSAYDVVIVDTGAGLSHEVTVPLGLADGILMVTTPDEVAVGDTIKTVDLADRVDGQIIGGLITRVTADTDADAIAQKFPFPTLGVIPVDLEATQSEPMVLNSPDSDASEAYEMLTSSLERVFFEDADGEDLEMIFETSWFTDEDEDDEDEGRDPLGGFRRFGG